MVDRRFLQRIGLSEDQVVIVTEALRKESEYRRILGSEHVVNIEAVMKITDVDEIDLSNEDLLREKIRIEYSDMIPAQYRKYQK